MDFREIKEFIKDFSSYIFIAFVALIIVVYIIGFEQIIGPSMNNTLKEDDLVIVDKLFYEITSLSRFDIVVLKQDEKHMVKRIIGLPDDHIKYIDGFLYVNDEKIEEKFIGSFITEDFKLEELKGDYLKIPKNQYLVLGDNRENSLDSRSFGLIEKENIIGRVIFRLLPINKIGIVK